jgi:uncharacterized delta-60 repeat protein
MALTYLGILSAAGAGAAAVRYWMALLGNTGEYSGDGAIDSAGNIIVSGSTLGGTDAEIAKYDTNGNILWQRKLASATSEYFIAADTDSSDNIYAAGLTSASGTLGGNAEWLFAKYNSSGSIQWQRGFSNDSGNFRDQAEDLAVDSSGNSYVVGYTSDSNTRDSTIVKWNSSGTIQWQREVNQGTTNDIFYSVTVDPSDNVYAVGYSPDAGFSSIQIFISKWNSSGTLQWQRRIQDYSVGEGVAFDSSGDIYIVSTLYSPGNPDIHISKYNASGTIQWQRRLSSASSDTGVDIAVSTTNNVYIVGTSDASGTNDIYIAKYNSSGTIQWQRRIRTTSADLATGIEIDSSENIIVFGYTNASTNDKIFIAKLPSDGSLTGTYSLGGASFIYEASSLTDASTSFTSGTPTFATRDPGFQEYALSLTDSSTSLTSTVTFI